MKRNDLQKLFFSLREFNEYHIRISEVLKGRDPESKQDIEKIRKLCIKTYDLATKLKYQK